MAAERIPMRKVLDILRLAYEAALDRRLFAVHGHAPTRKNTVTLGARSAATVRHALGWLSRMVVTRMVVT